MRVLKTLLFSLRWRFANGSRVSPAAWIKGHAALALGRKCKIHADASVDATRSPGVRFGDGVILNRYAYVQGGQGGVTLGDHVEVNNYAIVNGTGGITVGNDVLIGPGAKLISYQHRFAAGSLIRRQAVRPGPIRVGNDVWIGAGAIVLAGVSIGDGAVVAAGAVVSRDVAANTVVAGVPAVPMKRRE